MFDKHDNPDAGDEKNPEQRFVDTKDQEKMVEKLSN